LERGAAEGYAENRVPGVASLSLLVSVTLITGRNCLPVATRQ